MNDPEGVREEAQFVRQPARTRLASKILPCALDADGQAQETKGAPHGLPPELLEAFEKIPRKPLLLSAAGARRDSAGASTLSSTKSANMSAKACREHLLSQKKSDPCLPASSCADIHNHKLKRMENEEENDRDNVGAAAIEVVVLDATDDDRDGRNRNHNII